MSKSEFYEVLCQKFSEVCEKLLKNQTRNLKILIFDKILMSEWQKIYSKIDILNFNEKNFFINILF